MSVAASTKSEEARSVIGRCRRDRGFHASIQAYPEFWLRDLVFSEEALLRLGYGDAVRRQFEEFLLRQRESGQVPTVITTPWRAMLNQTFHSWTCDGEILLLVGVAIYARITGDSNFLVQNADRLEMCANYAMRGTSLDTLGFVRGMDWRDAIMNYRGRCLLANQLLLARMLDAVQRGVEASELRRRINEVFFARGEGMYADSVWWEGDGGQPKKDFNHFDCLGNSLAIIDGLAVGSAATRIAERFQRARSPFGCRNIFPPLDIEREASFSSLANVNAFVRNGAVFRNRPNTYQNSTIWPFVEGWTIRALVKLGLVQQAAEIYEAALRRVGLNEWYDPTTGGPRGSRGQLWTAASILDTKDLLRG